MTLLINGESKDAQAQTVAELVTALELPAQTLLIEHNGTALHRNEWASATLADGDKLELMRISAGG